MPFPSRLLVAAGLAAVGAGAGAVVGNAALPAAVQVPPGMRCGCGPWGEARSTTPAAGASGQGTMSGVSYIQRLNTRGGGAPAKACNARREGRELRVAYEADFVFYGPR